MKLTEAQRNIIAHVIRCAEDEEFRKEQVENMKIWYNDLISDSKDSIWKKHIDVNTRNSMSKLLKQIIDIIEDEEYN